MRSESRSTRFTERRKFLGQVGRGMLAASVGYSLAIDLGLATASDVGEGDERLSFGPWDEWVDFLQSTPATELLPKLVARLNQGTTLEDAVTAAALANARAFGGEDYIGFHTLMALRPALTVAAHLPRERAALPILKVLYRNSARIQEVGGIEANALKPLPVAEEGEIGSSRNQFRNQVRRRELEAAEFTLDSAIKQSPQVGLDWMMTAVEDATEVHRVVLIERAWDLVSFVGEQRASAMLRQSLRYCIKNEEWSAKNFADLRQVLPAVMDRYSLDQVQLGHRSFSDDELREWIALFFSCTPAEAAEATGKALSEGYSVETIAEAVSLAASQLVLRDVGRVGNQASPGKPEGSVHGDSIGVHACDSANAWRRLALVTSGRHSAAATVLGAYQVALDRVARGGDFANWPRLPIVDWQSGRPYAEAPKLLEQLDEAIRSNAQAEATTLAALYLEQVNASQSNASIDSLFSMLARYATSEDGALHAEKFFRTVHDEYHAIRPEFRDNHVYALARVTASEFGNPAPGYAESLELLGLS